MLAEGIFAVEGFGTLPTMKLGFFVRLFMAPQMLLSTKSFLADRALVTIHVDQATPRTSCREQLESDRLAKESTIKYASLRLRELRLVKSSWSGKLTPISHQAMLV